MSNRAWLLALIWVFACGGRADVASAADRPARPQVAGPQGDAGAPRQPGVIVGQILDERGRPFAHATVEALAARPGRQPGFRTLASTETDDEGAFRLAGISERDVYLRAFDPAFTRSGDASSGLRQYCPTYYPGVVVPAQATRITTADDVRTSPIVLKLETVRLAAVSGSIHSPDTRALSSGAVIMRPLAADGMTRPPQDATIRPDGAFMFRNVPPGDYDLRARGEVDAKGPSLFAAFRIRVEGRDLEHVDMTLAPGARIEGRVVIDSPHPIRPAKLFAGVRVRAPFADGRPFGEALTGDVQSSGAYAIRGVTGGRHSITLEGLPDGWVLKSVTWRGRDITDDGLDLTSRGTIADVRVTMTDVTTAIGGLVHDRSGAAIAGATVLIIPASPQFWTKASRRLRVLDADAAGRYQVRGLPPGEYRAVAVSGVPEGGIYDHDVLAELSAAGVAVSLKELASITVDLALTPPSGHPPSASR